MHGLPLLMLKKNLEKKDYDKIIHVLQSFYYKEEKLVRMDEIITKTLIKIKGERQ